VTCSGDLDYTAILRDIFAPSGKDNKRGGTLMATPAEMNFNAVRGGMLILLYLPVIN
jgi:hypothetical protein